MLKKLSPSARYALAIAGVGVATLVRLLLSHLLGPQFPFFSYYVAVTASLWLAGFGPAVAAAVLGFLSADLFFYSTSAIDMDPEAVIIYFSVTLTVCYFGKHMHEARRQSELSAAHARERQEELEKEIARRAEAEHALRLSEEQIRASFESSAVGQAQIDPDSGRFLRVNAKLCQMTGYSEQELLNMTVRQITYPEDNEWDTKTFRKMIQGKSEASVEKRYVRKGGTIIWVNVAASLIRDKENRPWRTVTVVQDINDRHKAEEALQVAQQQLAQYATELEKLVAERTVKLTETIQSLEGFCYSIAHDLRAPIRAMQGFASALADDLPQNETATGYSARIVRAAERMDQLVRDLLAYGRLTHEQVEVEQISLESFVDQVLAELADEIKDKRAQVYVLRPLPRVMGQPAVLKQVIVNLLHNAMTFVRPETPPRIYIRAEEAETTVRICVDDNGIGIAPEYHEQIFKVFERLHGTEEYPGTGIGLAIVKKGIERMGGHVGVESQMDHGSCFWFELKKQPIVHLLPPPVVEQRLKRIPKVAVR